MWKNLVVYAHIPKTKTIKTKTPHGVMGVVSGMKTNYSHKFFIYVILRYFLNKFKDLSKINF